MPLPRRRSIKQLAKSGRAPDLGDGSKVEDGMIFARGCLPKQASDCHHTSLTRRSHVAHTSLTRHSHDSLLVQASDVTTHYTRKTSHVTHKSALPQQKQAAAPPFGEEGMIGAARTNPGKDGTMFKVASWMGAIANCAAGGEGALEGEIFGKIKAALGPGQTLRDVIVQSIGRPDLAYKMAARIKDSGLPVAAEEISVTEPGALLAAGSSWGEIQVYFWIEG